MKGGFMSRRTTILTLVVIVGLAGACAKQEQVSPAEEAWSDLVEAWNGLETAEDKAALAENYLAEFPDTEHSGSMAGVVVYYRGHEMEDPQGAYDVVASVLEQIEDPGTTIRGRHGDAQPRRFGRGSARIGGGRQRSWRASAAHLLRTPAGI